MRMVRMNEIANQINAGIDASAYFEQFFLDATRAHPDDIAIWYNWALYEYKHGNTEAALKAIRHARQLAPWNRTLNGN